jgi:hypothetical protein
MQLASEGGGRGPSVVEVLLCADRVRQVRVSELVCRPGAAVCAHRGSCSISIAAARVCDDQLTSDGHPQLVTIVIPLSWSRSGVRSIRAAPATARLRCRQLGRAEPKTG